MIRKTSQSLSFESAEAECARLQEENARLRALLTEHNIPIPSTEPAVQPVPNPSKCCLRARDRNGPERESLSFEASFGGEKMSTRDDGKAQTDGRDIHRRRRKTGKRLTRASQKIGRKSIKGRESISS